jgi:hypothetical protein
VLARSIKAFLTAANVPFDKALTAVIVPDALDEAGQQILLDNLGQIGFQLDRLHLLPRPLAVALHWCQLAAPQPSHSQASDDADGTPAGRLRVLTMALDSWEAQSMEIRARRHFGRIWLTPMRDRSRLAGALPELPSTGLSLALACAHAESASSCFGWWYQLFGSDWIARRLAATRAMLPAELQLLRDFRSASPPKALRAELDQLPTLNPLWSRFFQLSPPLLEVIADRWLRQEERLNTGQLPRLAILADGAFACLPSDRGRTFAHLAGDDVHTGSLGHSAAVHGAALAATAIAYGLPCYRETLLPLDLLVEGRDEYGDPALQWKQLVAARSVEAGLPWRSPEPVTGLQIRHRQDRLFLPLRRSVGRSLMFRQVGTELTTPATKDQPVRIQVEVKPGQGFARVRIESVTPGVFGTRLDWRTMQDCDEPKPPPLAYPPGVSRIVPDRLMFATAQPALTAALNALENNSQAASERLRDAIKLLNKWPLAHTIERRRGHHMTKDISLHYGVIGSEGKLDELSAPGMARGLRNLIGERFDALARRGRGRSSLANTLLRAAGWFYLAMPEECYSFLRSQLRAATRADAATLSSVDLHAIGLAFAATEDLRVFYPLVVEALRHPEAKKHEWLRAVRNICRFRNHALHPDATGTPLLMQLFEELFETMRAQLSGRSFAPRIFSNCLESIPFLLKRRRYEADFLAPDSPVGRRLIRLLEDVERNHCFRLPNRLQQIPKVTLNFLRLQATATDLEQLLGIDDEEDDDD